MNRFSRKKVSQSGVALILILGIVALLTVMVVAFLGVSSRQINDAKGATAVTEKGQLAEFATSQFLTDIKNEILAGSISPASPGASGTTTLYPATALSAVPDRFTTSRVTASTSTPSQPVAAPPNLLKQSAYQRDFYDKNLGVEKISGLDIQSAFPKATAYPPSSRASSVSSASGAADTVPAARWNRPLLLPRDDPAKGDEFPAGYEPKTEGVVTSVVAGAPNSAKWTWQPPDWVYVAKDGSNPVTFNAQQAYDGPNPVVGRYAFQAYDVGGLLDLNVAGYVSGDTAGVTARDAGKKGSTGLADLTVLGLTADQIKGLLKFRNPATPGGSSGGPYKNSYLNFLLRTPDPKANTVWPANNAFLRVGDPSNSAFSSRRALKSFLLSGMGTGSTPASDSTDTAKLMEALQYLTHYSRGLEQPSYRPGFFLNDPAGARTLSNATPSGSTTSGPVSTAESPVFIRPSIVPPKGKIDDILYPIDVANGASFPLAWNTPQKLYKLPYEMALGNNRGGNDAWGTLDERSYGANPLAIRTSSVLPSQRARTTPLQDVINPAFLEVRVRTTFIRLDNTKALPGEPLVKKRFPLERLAWVTCKGPSAQLTPGDPQFNSLGTVDNIKKAFGLTWRAPESADPEKGYFWAYDHGKTGEILTLDEVADAQGREPDFIELLYATIAVGSVGKSAMADHNEGQSWDPATYQQVRDRTSRFQILEIAANLIDQADIDGFPTVIKLPNPKPDPDSRTAAPYYPALFTARGMEDLPYFYRLHWRAIKNKNTGQRADPDMDRLGNAGVMEISRQMKEIPGYISNYACGTTSLLMFPEVWNPHAQPLPRLPSEMDLDPTEFRILAASQTPSDVLVGSSPLAFGSSTTDRGLLTNPKLYDLTGTPTENSQAAWCDPNISKLFSSRAIGNFLFTYKNSNNIWSQNLWGWLLGSAYPRNPGARMDTFDTDGSLFWTNPLNAPLNTDNNFASILPDTIIKGAGAYEYPIYKFPPSMSVAFGDPDRDFRDAVHNRATLGSGTLVTSGTLADGSPNTLQQYDFLTESDLANDWSLSNGLDPARWYTLTDNTNSNFPLNRGQHFTAFNTIRIALSHANAGRGTPVFRHQTNPSPRNWVDFRGTELLFNNKVSLFREPTPLCIANQPSGSNLKAGDDNFFAGFPYKNDGGVVNAYDNSVWIGFSFGESPSQFVSAIRLEAGENKVIDKDPDTGIPFGTDDAGRVLKKRATASGLLDRKRDNFIQMLQPLGTGTVTTSTGLDAGPYFRFFNVPVNMVGLENDQMLTVQVQCKGPDGNWSTYDERFLRVKGGDASQTPVLGKSQLSPRFTPASDVFWNSPPADYRVNGTSIGDQMGWGNPLVTSFDPRSSRFGHPGRGADKSQEAVYGYQTQQAALNPISKSDYGILGLTDHNFTDRTSKEMIDSYSARDRASVLSLSEGVPAGWNQIDGFTWKGANVDLSIRPWLVTHPLPFRLLYDALQGKTNVSGVLLSPPAGFFAPGKVQGRATQPFWAQWWAQGKYNNQDLWQYPSVNAYDYGWFSRTLVPVKTTTPSIFNYSTSMSFTNRGTFSSDSSLPNFRRQWYWHLDLPPPDPGLEHPGNFDFADSLRIGCFSENIQPKYADSNDPLYAPGTSPEYRQAYADPDDVVRRAMGAFAAYGGYSSTPDGLPQGQLGSSVTKDNRPVVLNRAFQSVAEMGYAFRGAPWKNLSFSTPETGDAALLDVFCLTEPLPTMSDAPLQTPTPPLVAGKVNLNTRQEPVLTAMLNGALKDEVSSAISTVSTEAIPVARTLIGRTTANKAWLGPLTNVSDLAGKLFGKDIPTENFNMRTDPVYTSITYQTASEPTRNSDLNPSQTQGKLTWHFTGVSADLDSVFTNARDRKNLRMREAVIRALADGGQTRVWNIMLDLIVQTGRLKPRARDLTQFTKSAERRVWVFLAIDRLTGEVLDQQVEDVPD
ncbi:MAG: hypothetical protein DVB28_001804 [Verrucomicrobia bacterium]|nr:MAG: hypothetical protein DVB28_001804 [Verrucomicrobiota bacterium]